MTKFIFKLYPELINIIDKLNFLFSFCLIVEKAIAKMRNDERGMI